EGAPRGGRTRVRARATRRALRSEPAHAPLPAHRGNDPGALRQHAAEGDRRDVASFRPPSSETDPDVVIARPRAGGLVDVCYGAACLHLPLEWESLRPA